MANLSDYLENKIIDHMLRNQAFTPPTTIYIALFTAVTGLEANSPSAEVTSVATGYVRKAVTLNAASGGATTNAGDLDWGQATANYGTVTHVAVVDHVSNTNWGTGVNVLLWGELTVPKIVNNQDVFKILSGNLTLTML